MIEIRNLTKRFGPFTAVDGVSFTVKRGEVLGFLGPNGAGKSTTMKMVTGFLAPSGGTAVVAGHDVIRDPLAVKQAVGYLPEGAPAYPDMTPESFLDFCARVRGLRGQAKRQRIAEVVERVHLEGVMRQTIETLSKGFKRRVGLAQAILHDPDVLIMDEPTDGLDPNQKHEVRQLIREMAPRKAIVLSTHILEEVEAVCTRAVIINRGRIVFDGAAPDLQRRSRYCNAVALTVRTTGVPAEVLVRELSSIPSVFTVEGVVSRDGVHHCVVVPKNRQPIAPEVTRAAQRHGWQVESLAVEQGRLDDVFRDMTMSLGGAA
ncbi:MAG: ABC transporter ATP-binding protein [Phycisphaerales bacterium]